MRPWLLRPAFSTLCSRRLFSGVVLGDLGEVLRGHATAARRGWLVKANGHGLDSLEELDVVAGLQRDERLLPRRTLTAEPADALDLAAHDERADVGDGDLEQLLDRRADLDLVRIACDLEQNLLRVRLALGAARGAAAGLAKTCALLGEERTLDEV